MRNLLQRLWRLMTKGKSNGVEPALRKGFYDLLALQKPAHRIFDALGSNPKAHFLNEEHNLDVVLQGIVFRSYALLRGVFASAKDRNMYAAQAVSRSLLEHYLLVRYLVELATEIGSEAAARRYGQEYAAAEALTIEGRKRKYREKLDLGKADLGTQVLLQGYGKIRVHDDQIRALGETQPGKVMSEFGFSRMMDYCLDRLATEPDDHVKREFFSYALSYAEGSGISHGGPSGALLAQIMLTGGSVGFYWHAVGSCSIALALFASICLLYCAEASRTEDVSSILSLAKRNRDIQSAVFSLEKEFHEALNLPCFQEHARKELDNN